MTALSLIHQIFELLADHCTAEQGGRKLFIRSVNALLERSTLCSTADIDTVWRATWDKPLYADQYAHIATRLMDQLRAMQPCVLDDFRQLPQSPELLRGLKRYTVKHERLLELAKHWEDIHATHTATARVVEALFDKGLPLAEVEVSARRLLGAPGYVDRSDRSTLFSRLTAIKGYGQITALHICTDLGYPVYKPDRWVLRFAAVDRSVRATIESALPPDVALGRRLA